MALLSSASAQGVTSDLDVFAVPITQTSIDHSSFVEYRPIAALGNDSPIEFLIDGSGSEYIDTSEIYLYVKCKITRGDGTNLVADDVCAPANNFLHTLFRQVHISLNDKLISSSAGHYAYTAYLQTLLNYSTEAKTSHLTSGLWYGDTGGQFDTIGNANAGFQKRRAICNLSRTFDMYGKLMCDFMCQDRLLINNVSMRVKMFRTGDNFSIMAAAGANFRVQLDTVSLYVRRVEVSPDVGLGHAEGLQVTESKYPFIRNEFKSITLAGGAESYSVDNLCTGPLPKRLIVGFVSNTGYNGSFPHNPFNFQTFNLQQIQLFVGGQGYPLQPIVCNFNNDSFTQAFASLFSGTGVRYGNDGNGIDRDLYKNGCTLYCFVLSPSQALDGSYWDPIRQGAITLKVKFGEALANPVSCLVYAEFDALVQIDKHRNVFTDYVK